MSPLAGRELRADAQDLRGRKRHDGGIGLDEFLAAAGAVADAHALGRRLEAFDAGAETNRERSGQTLDQARESADQGNGAPASDPQADQHQDHDRRGFRGEIHPRAREECRRQARRAPARAECAHRCAQPGLVVEGKHRIGNPKGPTTRGVPERAHDTAPNPPARAAPEDRVDRAIHPRRELGDQDLPAPQRRRAVELSAKNERVGALYQGRVPGLEAQRRHEGAEIRVALADLAHAGLERTVLGRDRTQAAADPRLGFEDESGVSRARELGGADEARKTRADDDDGRHSVARRAGRIDTFAGRAVA